MAALGAAAFRSGITTLQSTRGWLCSLLVSNADPHGWFEGFNMCRRQHIMPERQSSTVVPEAILRELHDINSFLAADSRLDGRRRSSLQLSAQSLPAPLPPHEIESGLPSLVAHVRPKEGMARCAVKWLRRAGRVPGQVHSLMGSPGPGGRRVWELNLHFDENDLARLVRSFGRNGCTARVLQLKLIRPPSATSTSPSITHAGPASSNPKRNSDSIIGSICNSSHSSSSSSNGAGAADDEVLGMVRVKPVRVHMNAVTQRLEGIELLYCPTDRVVLVDVPIRLANDEMAPGVRKGGWMSMFKRTVRYKALGNAIPPFIELNVRHMDLDQKLLVRDLPIPPGTKIYEKNFNAPVVCCTTDVGKD
ncbi:hypothetical protein VaNZ11_001726 [Volvox africanus]|uniref:Large ribosomal subunit protein bL25 beta domain-containing protein n=1 Tax=Volvox africanus TaxID=51714 RepID=A0ABQ5RQE9_9CHLO|nr:hypothetical protein VaNZ11_001726 [Volvox africanus]